LLIYFTFHDIINSKKTIVIPLQSLHLLSLISYKLLSLTVDLFIKMTFYLLKVACSPNLLRFCWFYIYWHNL